MHPGVRGSPNTGIGNISGWSDSDHREQLDISDRSKIVIPETPVDKMRKRPSQAEVAQPIDEDDFVPQTPIGKMGSRPFNGTGKLNELLSKSMKNLRKKPLIKPPPKPTTRRRSAAEIAASLRAARSDYCSRFAPLIPLEQPRETIPTSVRAGSKVEEIHVDKDIIERYNRRIEEIRHSARKSSQNEIFYGRCTLRANLFDDKTGDESGVATRSTACMQMNRSGRSVKTNRVHMAHALLNVRNPDPLTACKPTKRSSFRLHRLIKAASKSDKKKLSKLKMRVARDKFGTPASTTNSNESISNRSSPVAKSEGENETRICETLEASSADIKSDAV